MSKKRFTYDYDEHNGNLFDNRYDTFYPIEDSEENIELLCKRLNCIVDDNKRLKSNNTIIDLECEIVKLKDDSIYYQIKNGECEEELLYLRRENEQLKSENKELMELVNKEVESWSDEKYQTVAEISNLMFSDESNERKK